MGGSFNPAHEGHRHVSIEALKRLKLDEVWWLVAEQNPLKPETGMAPFAARLKAVMPAHVPVIEFDCHINDEPFADALVAEVLRYVRPALRTG